MKQEYDEAKQAMINIGDAQITRFCETGDVMIQIFYGHIASLAGHVDGLCNLLLEKYSSELTSRPIILTTINMLQERITKPILAGEVPYITKTDVADVREVRTMLQLWIVTCMMLEEEFCTYLANKSANIEHFREWFECVRDILAKYYTGQASDNYKINMLPVVYNMNKAVVDLAALYIVLVPQHISTPLTW